MNQSSNLIHLVLWFLQRKVLSKHTSHHKMVNKPIERITDFSL